MMIAKLITWVLFTIIFLLHKETGFLTVTNAYIITLFNMVLEILASAMKQEIKDTLERRNATVFADNMIVYADNLK